MSIFFPGKGCGPGFSLCCSGLWPSTDPLCPIGPAIFFFAPAAFLELDVFGGLQKSWDVRATFGTLATCGIGPHSWPRVSFEFWRARRFFSSHLSHFCNLRFFEASRNRGTSETKVLHVNCLGLFWQGSAAAPASDILTLLQLP